MSNTTRAFTLIELMVVVVIMSVLTLSIVPSFSSYLKNQNLKQAQENLKSDLRSIQNKALTGTSSDQLVPLTTGDPARYWGVQFTNGATGFDTFVSAAQTDCNVAKINTTNLKITGGATVTSATCATSPCCLFMDMSDGDITASGMAQSICGGDQGITLTAPGAATPKHVCFNSHGLIYGD